MNICKQCGQMDFETDYLENAHYVTVTMLDFSKDAGITLIDYRTLSKVRHDPQRLLEISKNLGVSQQAVGVTLRRLQSKGFLVIEKERNDKRANAIYLTESGAAMIKSGSKTLAKTIEGYHEAREKGLSR